MDYSNIILVDIETQDIRFPTSKTNEGTDAVHVNCDYSAAYLTFYSIYKN